MQWLGGPSCSAKGVLVCPLERSREREPSFKRKTVTGEVHSVGLSGRLTKCC